jgi:hypothetical protein
MITSEKHSRRQAVVGEVLSSVAIVRRNPSGIEPRISSKRRWPTNPFGGDGRGRGGERFAQGGRRIHLEEMAGGVEESISPKVAAAELAGVGRDHRATVAAI